MIWIFDRWTKSDENTYADCLKSGEQSVVIALQDDGFLPAGAVSPYRCCVGEAMGERMEEMEENVYLTEFHTKKGHMDQIAELDNRFHDILYEACDSKMLEHLLKDYHNYVLRVRKKSLATDRASISNNEHRLIMEAIRDKDADRAEELANAHMVKAFENMVESGIYQDY